MGYKVAIRKNETGEVRVYDVGYSDWDTPDGHNDLFWWTEGNFGCDCNRFASWMRAGGEDPGEEDWPCGNMRYTVLYADLPDGRRIEIDRPTLEVEL